MIKKGVVYPEHIREKARDWFMKGYSFSWIAKWIKENSEYKTCRHTTIRNWANEKNADGQNWISERATRAQSALVKRQQETGLDIPEQTKIHLEAYQKMITEGRLGLDNMPIESAREAAELVDKGIKGERMVSGGLIQLAFIQQVIKIVQDEVADEETLVRISNKLKLLAVRTVQGSNNAGNQD